ncbi:hypothetical protein [Corynebacterium sp.]|uniref:hypothetical protein n=1 Tax=Corynebacterium sp. TaxID=1720 RepID=UPI0019886577|nr:hypothetical protein [Corynebacterium sp.]HHU66449.1 hypothetical protein [Corynebacterium sp.]
MLRKSIVALATTALVLGGTSAVANAQSAAPYPSSQIPVDHAWVQGVQNVFPGAPADQVHAGIQMGVAWAIWSVGSSLVGGGLGLGSSALTSSL